MTNWFSFSAFDKALDQLHTAINNSTDVEEKTRLSKLAKRVAARKAEVLAEQLLDEGTRFE
jgi:hypothetical protein